jgi:O-antigen/teichoic acid export membrane protein
MTSLDLSRFYIFFFRSAALGIKAVFMLFAARALSSAQYGQFVLFLSNMAIILSFLGINLNQYTSRKIHNSSNLNELVTDHFLSVALTGFFFLIVISIFSGSLGITSFIFYFFLITFLEHMTNEAYFLLLPLGKPLLANVIFFVKVLGSYGLMIIYFFSTKNGEAELKTCFTIWLVSNAIVGIFLLIKYPPKIKFQFQVLKTGWKTGLVYLGIAVVTKSFYNLDKIYLSQSQSLENVGYYGMVFSIAWTVHTLVEASLIGPAIQKFLIQPKDHQRLIRLILKTTTLYAVLWLMLWAAFPYIVSLLNKPELVELRTLLNLLLATGLLYSISLCFSMNLYTLHKDKSILISSLMSFVLLIGLMMWSSQTMSNIAWNLILVSVTYLVLLISIYKSINFDSHAKE